MKEYKIAFLNHLIELKYRVFYIVLSGFLSFLVAYVYSLELFYLIAKPLIYLNLKDFEYSLIYTDITEAFFTYLNLSLSLGFGILLLNTIHQFILFLIPGLFEREASFLKRIRLYTYFSCFLTIICTYSCILPFIWYFFISNDTSTTVSSINIHFEGKINEYVLLVIRLLVSLVLVFLFPIFLVLNLRIGILSLETIINQRHFGFILIFILGAFLSPPDVISQLFLALPLCISYELIILLLIFKKNGQLP
jgi:sec-independent protein translocase protein TatC